MLQTIVGWVGAAILGLTLFNTIGSRDENKNVAVVLVSVPFFYILSTLL